MLEESFQRLADWWHTETSGLSSITMKSIHPAYQQIIDLGPEVIPIILRDLQKRPDHWFWALRQLTGENPVRQEDAGRLKLMAEAWLAWGKDHGYIG